MPWTPRGPQSDPLGALFIFCKPGFRVKAACRTKKGHLRTSERSSFPLVTHSALGWVLSCFLGPRNTYWALSGLRWAPKSDIFVICYYFFLVRDFGPLPKK